MKIATLSASLAVFATANAFENVTLTAESSNKDIDGQSLNNIHFGAGINGVLLGNFTTYYGLDPELKTVSEDLGRFRYQVSQLWNNLVVGVTGPPYALVENNYLTINGSDSVFYACSKLAWDPYEYLEKGAGYGVGVYADKAPSECQPIKVKVNFVGEKKNSSAPKNSTHSTTPPSSNNAAVVGVSSAGLASAAVAAAAFYML